VTSLGPQGLQAERTALAWSRTSLAVLVNGLLLVLKELSSRTGAMALAAAGLAGIIAVGVYLIGVRRQRSLARRPLPLRLTAGAQVHAVGTSVLVLIAVTALGLFLGAG
jgi:uncharacterized membrane protein YidH (DUF202 family)